MNDFCQVPSTRIKKAIFRKKETEFLSDCHPDKHWLKGGSEACDFTSKNSGMSWFCTRFPGFRCEDVTSMKTGYVLDKDLPMTDAEKELFRYCHYE